MDSTRQSKKVNPDPVLGELQRANPPASAEERKPRRESLIEAAMDVAATNASRRAEVRDVAIDIDAALLRRPEMKATPERQPEAPSEGEPATRLPPPAPRVETRKKEARGPGLKIESQRNASIADVAEHCDRLRAHLSTRYPGAAMKVILFVGISSGSGASTAAANFAASLAQDEDSKVLLMDANYRSAKKQESDAPLGESAGRLDLAHLLDDPTPVCPVPGPSNLYILPRGKPTSMPLSLFQSDAFDELLRKLREEFKYVVIDGPALQGFPESVVLSRKADGVILVLESEKTRKRTAQSAKEQIEGAGGKLLGVVLNKRKYYIPNWLYQYL
jgi:capsular exopolysaccharide synthesis family protein